MTSIGLARRNKGMMLEEYVPACCGVAAAMAAVASAKRMEARILNLKGTNGVGVLRSDPEKNGAKGTRFYTRDA